MMRRLRLALAVGLVAAAMIAPTAGTAPAVAKSKSSPAAGSRGAKESYTTTPLGGVNCGTNRGGACFELAGDERQAGIVVLDDKGWLDLPAHYEFRGADGRALASGELCDSAWVVVPSGARRIVVAVATVTTATACGRASVSVSGEITVTYDVTRKDLRPPIDGERTCSGDVAEPVSLALAGDTGQRVTLDILVLLDGVDQAYAQGIMDDVTRVYDRVGITVAATYQTVTLSSGPDADALFDEIRAMFSNRVPEAYDIVHTLTAKDVTGLAGIAYCVGGLRSPENAFSIAEGIPGKPPDVTRGVPVPVWPWVAEGYISAHEIGHLLGGNHDYANCVEGVTFSVEAVPGPCTLMHANFNISFAFSTLNRIEVRGYALRFATP
ncbi:MAG: hypothetical protein H0U92_10780 [Actinobacteria bacterium]|nr:hypothetical protein [Actinomycetota bacterium]